jgi:hypothetical protein
MVNVQRMVKERIIEDQVPAHQGACLYVYHQEYNLSRAILIPYVLKLLIKFGFGAGFITLFIIKAQQFHGLLSQHDTFK